MMFLILLLSFVTWIVLSAIGALSSGGSYRYRQEHPWQARFITTCQILGVLLICAFILFILLLPFLWWGTIGYVAWHFIQKVW